MIISIINDGYRSVGKACELCVYCLWLSLTAQHSSVTPIVIKIQLFRS